MRFFWKRSWGMALPALLLTAAGSQAQVYLAADITYYEGVNVLSIYGRAFHTNLAAVSLTTNGLLMYSFTTINGSALTAGYPVFDSSPKDENWGAGAPSNSPSADNFMCRWEGYLDVPASSNYTLNGGADDLLRVYVDGSLLYDNRQSALYPGTAYLAAGRHGISWQFGEGGGGAWYGVTENVTGGNSNLFVAATGHPFAGYALDYRMTYSNAVSNAVVMDIYDAPSYNQNNPTGATMSVFRGTRIFRGSFNPGCWWGGYDGPSTNDLFGTPEVNDDWAVRLRGEMYFGVASNNVYRFTGGADDQLQLYIDTNRDGDFWDAGEYVFNKANHPTSSPPANAVTLTNGWYPIQLEFYEIGGGASFNLQRDDQQGAGWKYAGTVDVPVRTAAPVDEWLSITNRGTPVGSATTEGLLGVFNAKALGLPQGFYTIRLRAFDTATSLVKDTFVVRVRDTGGTVIFIR